MGTAQFQVTNFTVDDAATIKAKIDGNFAVAQRISAAYQCYANSPAGMTVKVAAGALLILGGLVENAIQTSGTITAPSVNPRIDRVVIDAITGVASIITGAEAGVPVPPAIPTGKLPCAQISLAISTTAITNILITDERTPGQGRATGNNIDFERAARRGRHFAALNLV
jgi:hypothetical protein